MIIRKIIEKEISYYRCQTTKLRFLILNSYWKLGLLKVTVTLTSYFFKMVTVTWLLFCHVTVTQLLLQSNLPTTDYLHGLA